MKRYLIVTLLVVGILLGATSVLGATFFWSQREKVLPGVKVREVDLQGFTRDRGIAALKELEKELQATPVVLKYQEHSWELPLKEVDLRLDAAAMMDDALRAGREGSFYRQWQQRRQIREQGYAVPFRVVFNEKKFAGHILKFTEGLGYPPVDASFRITPDDRVEIVPGKEGLQADVVEACRRLREQLGEGQQKKLEVALSLVPVKPHRTTEAVTAMGLKGLLSSYTTSFDPANVGRTYNIRVAAAALDGLLVPPGQEVSFNAVVGPRSTEAGYKNAKVIINDEFVEGIGGGVCQVSSTLYNAILLANLEILDRTNHSLPVGYVPLGRDATVVYGAIDFKFRNNTESYIYIRSAVKGKQLTFKVYGNSDERASVSIRSRIIKEIEPKVIYQQDPNLKKGEQVVKQEGAKGYQVVTERVVWENGREARVEKLLLSSYQPVNKIIVTGTKEEATPVFLPPGALSPGAGKEQPPLIPPAGDGANQNKETERAEKQPDQKTPGEENEKENEKKRLQQNTPASSSNSD